VFALFDDLLLLGRTSAKFGGRTVYSGPAQGALGYFEGLGYAFPPKVRQKYKSERCIDKHPPVFRSQSYLLIQEVLFS
jgi:hypothetical protein